MFSRIYIAPKLSFSNVGVRQYTGAFACRFIAVFRKEGILRKRNQNLLKAHHRKVVKDQDLAQKLTPDFEVGCKRITPSNQYLQSFNRDNVTLVTQEIDQITENGIRSKDGVVREVDTIVYATGFSILQSSKPFACFGLSGSTKKSLVRGNLSLTDEWSDEPNAYLGIVYPDYPNAFLLLGPGTGTGHNSAVYMIECQINYVVDAIRKMIKGNIKSMNLKREVNEEYQTWVKATLQNKVFAFSTCKSWYKNDRGTVYTLWPSNCVLYWWMTRRVNLDHYVCSCCCPDK